MGAAIPQVITGDRASGAQVIDGSLKFDGSRDYLIRNFGSGNRRTWTWAAWVKRYGFGVANHGLFSYYPGSGNGSFIRFSDDSDGDTLRVFSDTNDRSIVSKEQFRDTGWYHIVIAVDTTRATDSDRVKRYVNGVQQTTNASASWPSASEELLMNQSGNHYLGRVQASNYGPVAMSNVYFIDGAALGPENFGFTDPLTNTWRPKKYNHRKDLYGVTWSSALVGDASGFQSAATAADGFNGKVGTDDNSYAQNNTGSNPSTITFTPVGGIKFNSSIQVYLINAANTVNVNGEGAQTIAANEWVTVKTGSGTLNTLVFSRPSTSGASFGGIRIDGHILIDAQVDNSFYLPMDGNSPIGEDKIGNGNNWTPTNFGGSVALDKATGALPILNTTQGGTQAAVGVRTDAYAQGDPNNPLSRNYSINTTATGGFSGSYPKTNLFDGQTPSDSNRAEAASNDDPINITFDPPITVSSTISLWSGKSSTRYQINDSGSYTTYSDAVGSYKDISHSGSLSNIKILHGSGGEAAGISAIKIDGTQLIDAGLVLALPLVGNTNDVSNQINSGSTTKVMSSGGDPSASTVTSNFYSGSFEFDGNDYLEKSVTSELTMGTGDFTVEFWYKVSASFASDNFYVFDFHTNGLRVQLINSTIAFGTGSNYVQATVDGADTNSWHHIAVQRSGSNCTLYYNGVNVATMTSSEDIGMGNPMHIGQYGNGGHHFEGYLQDFRVYKGVAKYASNFIPAATSPDILPDTPSGGSGGSKLTKITDGAVAFDGNDDYLTCTSSDFAFGTGDFTVEAYVYCPVLANYRAIATTRPDNGGHSDAWHIGLTANGSIPLYSNEYDLQAPAGSSPQNRWFHLAVTRSSSAAKMFVDGKLVASGTVTKDYTRTALGIGDFSGTQAEPMLGFISNLRIIKGTALYTSEFTPPTRALTNVTNTKLLCCQSNRASGAAAVSPNISGVNDGTVWSSLVTGSTRKEDRVANAFDGTTNGPGAIAAYPGTLTFAPGLTSISSVRIYGYYAGSGVTLHVNGAAQSPSSGASFDITISTSTLDSIVWTATNGFNYMRLDAVVVDGTTLIDPVVGADDSNEVATTFNPFNTDINTVRGQETGYCTLNPLAKGAQATIGNGNLEVTAAASGSGKEYYSTLSMSSGKWYAEFKLTGTACLAGISNDIVFTSYFGSVASGYGYYNNGNTYNGGTAVSYGDSVTTGDVLGIIFDADNGELFFSKNGIIQNSGIPAYTGLTNGPYWFGGGENGATGIWNFGQKPFKFTPPDGFQSLNLANVRPETVIARPDRFVGVTTYTGISGDKNIVVGFKPDLIMSKDRENTRHWGLYDTIRGTGKVLYTSDASTSQNTSTDIQSFNYNGYTIGSDDRLGGTDIDYVNFFWKAGGNEGTFNKDGVAYASAAAAGLTAGTITPDNCSIGTKQGFSIIKFDGNGTGGATVPHGLSQTPDFTILKQITDSDESWRVNHKEIASNKTLYLNQNREELSNTEYISGKNSTTITLSTGLAGINKINVQYMIYLWHDVPGLQKFGKYTGDASNNPFIELGFRPALLWIKNISTNSTDWIIIDSKRHDINSGTMRKLYINSFSSETSIGVDVQNNLDILSNGFKLRDSNNRVNASNDEYVYCAWAESPTVNLFGGQSNAR